MKGNTLLAVIASLLLIASLSISYKNNQQIKELRQENTVMLERIDSLINLAHVQPKSTNTQVADSLSDAVNEAAYEIAETGKGLFEFFNAIIEGISNGIDKGNGSKAQQAPKPKMVVTSKYRMEDRYVTGKIVNPEIIGDETGQVDINISIDFLGQVVSAKLKSSTGITNEDVIEACKKAALRTKFNSNVHESNYHPGTITYFFKME